MSSTLIDHIMIIRSLNMNTILNLRNKIKIHGR